MGLVLGILVGIFILGVFFRSANAAGAFAGFAASTIVMIIVKYVTTDVSIWSYSLISILVCLAVGLLVSWIYNKTTGKAYPAPRFTVYHDFKKGLISEEQKERSRARSV